MNRMTTSILWCSCYLLLSSWVRSIITELCFNLHGVCEPSDCMCVPEFNRTLCDYVLLCVRAARESAGVRTHIYNMGVLSTSMSSLMILVIAWSFLSSMNLNEHSLKPDWSSFRTLEVADERGGSDREYQPQCASCERCGNTARRKNKWSKKFIK